MELTLIGSGLLLCLVSFIVAVINMSVGDISASTFRRHVITMVGMSIGSVLFLIGLILLFVSIFNK